MCSLRCLCSTHMLQPDTRLTQFRSLLKEVVDHKIEAFYYVGPTHKNVKQRLDAWLANRRYLFAGDPLRVSLRFIFFPYADHICSIMQRRPSRTCTRCSSASSGRSSLKNVPTSFDTKLLASRLCLRVRRTGSFPMLSLHWWQLQ